MVHCELIPEHLPDSNFLINCLASFYSHIFRKKKLVTCITIDEDTNIQNRLLCIQAVRNNLPTREKTIPPTDIRNILLYAGMYGKSIYTSSG